MTEADQKIVASKIDAEKEFLNSISQKIWKKPELKYNEVYAHDTLTGALEKYGFAVQRNYLLPTAFKAEYSVGDGPTTIAILLEYDALPSIGHACGHNLIAEAGLAAGIAIKAAMDNDKTLKGKVVLLGTPAEEAGGGKIQMIQLGAFKNVSAALMVHPSNFTMHDPPILSKLSLNIDYKGKETHASAFPWKGINALDAVVTLYQSMGLLRQQIKPTSRIHAIITKGGEAANIIPAEASIEIHLRTSNKKELRDMKSRTENCIKGAAQSTGCTYSVNYNENRQYDDLVTNQTICELFSEFCTKFGLPQTDLTKLAEIPMGSTDMGNVSYVVPSIHPFYDINTETMNHTKDFTTAAGSEEAQKNTLISAKAMAMTALALLRDGKKVAKAKKEFDEKMTQLKAANEE